jgi:dihydroorotate dehydrogenase electron transfer subunit
VSDIIRGQFQTSVLANQPLCDEHWRLTVGVAAAAGFPPTAPGQFIQLSCGPGLDDLPDIELDWPARGFPSLRSAQLHQRTAMLRRPFSLAGRRDRSDGSVELDIIHRVVGAGTEYLSTRQPGDALSLIGPLGNRFPLPGEGETALLIGGGVGIPPMLYLAAALAGRQAGQSREGEAREAGEAGGAAVAAVAFAGALRRSLLPLNLIAEPHPHATRPSACVEEFARYQIPTVIATDDGSAGCRGFVTQALEAYLDAHAGEPAILYTCGPEPMMKRVAALAAQRRLICHVAIERAMACGMGTCQSCCIKVRKPDPAATPLPGRQWAWRLACTDGPVFPADTLLW